MSTMRRAVTVLAVVGCATASASCAPADLGRAGSPEAVAAALGRATAVPAAPTNAQGRPLAYLALGGAAGSRLAAFDLAQSRMLWSVPTPITGRVVAGVSILIHADGAALVARDVASGAARWRTPLAAGLTLVGYAVDGDSVYYVARRGNELRGGESELVALNGRSGGVLWRRALGTANVGGPAARGGIVAVPNRSQFVSLLDGRSGAPLAQALSKEQAANFVEALPEGLFYGFGADGAYLLSADTAVGVRASPGYLRAKFPPFVRPVYHFDMYRPELTDYSAVDRNRVLWRAEVHPPRARFSDGTVCVLNYRFFFGFDATTGSLRWAYNNPIVEAVSASHTGAAIIFATANGEIGALDPRSGRSLYRSRLAGDVIVGATFDAEGYAPNGGEVGNSSTLASVLSSVVWDPDRRFSEVQIFAVDQLAKIPGRDVTADLLRMLGSEVLQPGVVKRAARALVERKDSQSIDLFVGALGVHADYAAVAGPAAVANLEVLARAAGALRAKETALPLAEHLRLPETEPAAVLEIARALAAMHADVALPQLRDYLAVYRTDPLFGGDPSPLLAIVDALIELGAAPERELLMFVAEDPRTLPPLKEYVRRVLIQTARANETAEKPRNKAD